MGIQNQLLFPNTTLRELRMPTPAALEACRRYNDYVVDWTARADGRARAVCQINMSDHEWAVGELRRVIDAGSATRGLAGARLPTTRLTGALPAGGVVVGSAAALVAVGSPHATTAAIRQIRREVLAKVRIRVTGKPLRHRLLQIVAAL